MPGKILIVDDEKMLTNILSEYFQTEKGYVVLTVEDGQTAKLTIEKERLDLVLLDMKLPKVDGIEILKLLREQHPQTKVIAMTCYDVEYKKRMDEIGYDHFFMKPLSIVDLQDKVEELLGPGAQQQLKSSKEDVVLEGVVPKAKLLVIEPRENIVKLLKDFFEEKSLSGGEYAITNYFIQNIKEIEHFGPDIVLYDIFQIGEFSDFASKLMQFKNPPKEIILFGDPGFKWEEVDALVERGMEYVQTPLENPSKSFSLGHEFDLPTKETIQRLSTAVRNVCLKHGLYKEKIR